jgi:trehalose 6-phosphate synthase/phosphatase
MKARSRLIIVSNRLPTTIDKLTDEIRPASGGLVTALTSLCRNRNVAWIGWPGAAYDEALEAKLANQHFAFQLCPVWLTEQEHTKYYYGLSNEIIWPLFHDLQSRCNFEPGYWDVYGVVNRKFADTIATIARPDDQLWVHDYHLALVGRELKRLGVPNRSAYFHHIPFPAIDIFEKLPWREDFLEALLHFDQLGFQTLRDAKNFTRCIRRLLDVETITRDGDDVIITSRCGRTTRVGHYPISIDFNEFAEKSHLQSVRDRAHELRGQIRSQHLLLGVDRLDYTKGIPERLKAFATALQQFPELRRAATLVQVVVPSREDIPMYRELKMEVDRLVTEINGRFTEPGWVPIHFIYRNLEREELVAFYHAADVALVTPLRDGMNLVAKEYCACQVARPGVLVLSEFAGAAPQLSSGALVVNPYDRQALASAIRDACLMPESLRRQRMHMMRKSVKRFDVHWWARKFLGSYDEAALLAAGVAMSA